MTWYGYGWWWWWIAFVILFFLLPLAYGWAYRGWGPWFRRRSGRPGRPPAEGPEEPGEGIDGWGWIAVALWIVVLLAIIWFFWAWGWGWRPVTAPPPGRP